MSRIRKIPMAILAVCLAIQFIQPARNQSGQVMQTDISNTCTIPDSLYTLLKNACYDCHSNTTYYPIYSYIQPMGWILARDVKNGKAKLNFSEFGSIASRRQISKLQDVENRIKDGSMPLFAYQFMHKNARLTKEEKELLIGWIQETKDSITLKRSGKQTQQQIP